MFQQIEGLSLQKFPAMCAHRGLSALCPENTMPAFAAAIALGAQEIEFDVWLTKDEQLVISHDPSIDRMTDGNGMISDLRLEELMEVNAGHSMGWQVPLCTVEQVFAAFGKKAIMNVHINDAGKDGIVVKLLRELIIKYGLYDYVYFAGINRELYWMQQIAPEVPRCAIQLPHVEVPIYDMAVSYGCSRVQFWRDMFDDELIKRLKSHGIVCNLFYSDDIDDMKVQLGKGIDVILTNRADLGMKLHRALEGLKNE